MRVDRFEEKDTYYVAVKMFLERKDGKLFIFRDIHGSWDLPGGRIKKDEFETSLQDIIKRKMLEELGDDIAYTVGRPVVFMRHERVEDAPGNPIIRIFAIGYECKLEKGTIKLGKVGVEGKWFDPNEFKPEEYLEGGWLEGMKEYLEKRNQR